MILITSPLSTWAGLILESTIVVCHQTALLTSTRISVSALSSWSEVGLGDDAKILRPAGRAKKA